MAGVAGWGSRKTLEEMQARARQMYGPFRDETRTDPLTGLSYQFSDIRPGQDRTDPVWLTPEQNEATRAYFTDGGRIGDDGLIQKDVTKPAFSQNSDGSYSSGSTTQTVTAPNVGTAWGYTGKPGVFTKSWGALTGDDFPDQVRAKTPWSEAAFNSVDPFLPWSEEEGARIPPALSSLVTEPARLAEKGIKGQEFSPADNAILGMTLFAAGGVGKGLASGKQGGVLGRAGSKLGLEDPLLNTPETSTPSIAQNYRDAQSPMFAAGDEKSAFALGGLTNDQRPFYGRDVGPKGRIGDVEAETARLGLRSGLPEYPTGAGFFNPATAALLQEGVQPRQTVAYYQKQMGGRGGKLPPGQWEDITQGLRPDETIDRDWLVKEIDARAPAFDTQRYVEDYDGSPGQAGTPEYQNYSTNGPFENYSETVLGYPSRNHIKPHPVASAKHAGEWDALNKQITEATQGIEDLRRKNSPAFALAVEHRQKLEARREELHRRMVEDTARMQWPGVFTDNHFDHPNMEGWYRTQDAQAQLPVPPDVRQAFLDQWKVMSPAEEARLAPRATTRIAEELQPQRYQKMRDVGEADPAALARTQADLKQLEDQIPRVQQDVRATIQKEAPSFAQHFDEAFYFRGIADSFHDRNVLRGAAGILGENHPKVQAFKYALDQRSHLLGAEKAAQKGVAKSPYTHDINASTDLLLKHLTGKAARDDVDRLAWTPGETQAERYNQALKDVRDIRYNPDDGTLYIRDARTYEDFGGDPSSPGDAMGWRSVASGVKPDKLADYVGGEAAKTILSTPRKEIKDTRGSWHRVEFPEGMTLGGEGMKGFYGSGPYGEGGIFTSRVKALWKKLTGQEPEVKPSKLPSSNSRREGSPDQYPSVDLTPEMRDTIRRVGLSMYSSGDEKAAAFLAQFDREGQGLLFGDEQRAKPAYEQRQLDANGLYSVLDESLPKINRKQANAQAWLNEMKKLGVKDQEIYWRGLDDFLKSKGANGQFSKDEIAAYLGNNKVKIWDETHTTDGTTAEQLRDSEYENLRERIGYDFDPTDWGYKIEEYEPSAEEITKHIARTYKIQKTDQSDLFADDTQAPEGSYAVLDDDGTVREYADSKEDAERAAREFAKEDLIKQAEEDGESWVLYDKDGDEYNRYGDEDEATDKARELAADNEHGRISNMTDQEVWDEFGDGSERGTMAEGYMGAKPEGGANYNETVFGIDPATLARKGSKGWTSKTGMRRDSAHPDSPYNHALGWRLQEEYRDLMNPKQTGLLAHEAQSRWTAEGGKHGFKQQVSPERVAELQREADTAEASWRGFAESDPHVEFGSRVVRFRDGTSKDVLGKANANLSQRNWAQSALDRATRDLNYETRVLAQEQKMLDETPPDGQIEHRTNELASQKAYVARAEEKVRAAQDSLSALEKEWEEISPLIEEDFDMSQAAEGQMTPSQQRYRDFVQQRKQLKLRYDEAAARLHSASGGGIEPGPFVTEKADLMGLLLKTGLYQAAKEGHDFFGVSGAKRLIERWGDDSPHEDYGRIDPKTGREAGVIPMSLQKLARMHKKDAKVEPLYPGNRKVSKGYYNESPDQFEAGGYANQLPLETPAAQARRFSTSSKVEEVVLTVGANGEPVYTLKASGSRSGEYATYLTDKGTAVQLKDYRGQFRPDMLQFKTREAAEAAMQQINKSKVKNYREINDPEALKSAFEENDPVGEPFNAVRLDDDLRESIRKRGFPMFAAGDERAALMAGAFAESSNPTVRAAQKRAADVPFADKLVTQHNMRGRSFDHNVSSYGGNIPVPSLALSKAGDPLTNFGDISLFGPPEMAIPKGSNPVYPGDAYTQRAPRLVRDVPKSADRDRLYEKLTGEKGKGYKLNLDDPFWDDGFRAGYLRSKGMTPPEGADLDRWVRDNIGYGERDSVERFVADFLDSHKGVIRERIDKGWSNDGERRLYAPHTLADMVKASKGRAGSEDFDYGPMAWKAATMSPFQSLRDIQDSRGLIRTEEKAALDAQEDQLANMGFDLARALGYRDTHPEMIMDGLRSKDPDVRALAQELRAALKSLPTEYFEAKPQRAVDMGEFKAAAVPQGMDDAAAFLARKGLDVRRIPEGENSRRDALIEILQSRPDLLFSDGEPGAAFAPAPEEDEKPSGAEGLASRLMKLWDRK